MSKLLEGLNPAQSAAVINFQDPSLIIAGAGSGKTRVLTSRIGYMLQQGVDPRSILALTFTNKAASQMRERLQEMIDPALARQITMGTFHSIFSRIIRENAEALGYPTAYTIYQPSDAKALIKSIIKEMNLNDDKYKPANVLSRISFAKNSLVTPGAYAANDTLITEDQSRQMPRLSEIYNTYCIRCKASGALDFDDLLLQTNILFRDFPEILRRYQERFQYILVDEYQDTNFAQYIIIRRLSQLHSRVCVVGDDAQSIYSFRGAKIENILNFQKHFPTAKTYKLEQNYRSTRTIVDAANSLIAHNKNKLDKRCFSEGEMGEKIRVMRAATDREEATLVVESMRDKMQSGNTSWGEFAILYRTNSQSQALEQILRQKGIPYQIHRGSSFYEHKEIKDILAYIRLVINPRDDEAFRRIINYPTRGIGNTTFERIEALAKERKVSLWEGVDTLVEQAPADALQRTIIRKVKEFVELIRSLSLQRETLSLYDFGMAIVSQSGILPAYRAAATTEATGAIENIEELLNTMQLFNEQVEAEIRNGERLEGERATIEEWLQSVLLLTDQEDDEEQGEKVTLMTVHSSKGLEYDHIYIVGVEHNLFPSQRAIESGEVEEERRLFYVAITRAKITATLSYCDMRFKWGELSFSSPSSFLGDIDSRYIDPDEEVELKRPATQQYRERSTERGTTVERRQQPQNRTQAIDQLRKQYDYRHQQRREDTSGMRSLGVRASNAEESATGSNIASKYAVGEVVTHAKFGRGRVTAVSDKNGMEMVDVEFESVGMKSLASKFAPLTKM